MSRKRSAGALNECNNNLNVSLSANKKRCKTIAEQLQSNLTSKMLEPMISPKGHPTSRAGRMINQRIDIPKTQRDKTNKMAEHSKSPNKRKVRKTFLIQNFLPQLRFVKFHEPNVHTQRVNLKSISINKIGLNNDQFQSTNTISTTSRSAVITDFFTKTNTKPMEHTEKQAQKTTDDNTVSNVNTTTTPTNTTTTTGTNTTDPIAFGSIDFEDDLNKISYHIVAKRSTRNDSDGIIEEIDLTELSDCSDNGDEECKLSTDEAEQLIEDCFPTPEADSTSTNEDASQNKTDSDSSSAILIEMDNNSKPISDCEISTSVPSVIIDKAFSECTDDDCIMTGCDNVDSTENWQVGQIVWAAFPKFWPAIICEDEDERKFQKGTLLQLLFRNILEVSVEKQTDYKRTT